MRALELPELLLQEGSSHPRFAHTYRRLAQWYDRASTRSSLAKRKGLTVNAADYVTFAHNKALEYARSELEANIVCDGEDSPVVQETLEYIRGLEAIESVS